MAQLAPGGSFVKRDWTVVVSGTRGGLALRVPGE